MKLMNEVKAGVRGRRAACICVDNETAVQYGDSLELEPLNGRPLDAL